MENTETGGEQLEAVCVVGAQVKVAAVLMNRDQVTAVPVVVNENSLSVPETPPAGAWVNRRVKM
jgi:hypothetical protein